MQGIAVPGGRRPRRAASPEPQRAPFEGAFLVCWGTFLSYYSLLSSSYRSALQSARALPLCSS